MTTLAIQVHAVLMQSATMVCALAYPNTKAIHTADVDPSVSLTQIAPGIRRACVTNALIPALAHVDKTHTVKYSIMSPCVVVPQA